MLPSRFVRAAVVAVVLAACSGPDDPGPTAPHAPGISSPDPIVRPAPREDRDRHERLAARMARALRNPEFRASVAQELARSPFAERKVHLQAFLGRDGGAVRRRFAALAGDADDAVAADLERGRAVELYFPVAEHRLRWQGGDDLLVATAELDSDQPVAFDLFGRRTRLSNTTPPDTPVLMVSAAEVDFGRGPAATDGCIFDCGGDTGGGTGGGGTGGATQGLFMTGARFTETFESWFKGSPEFEVHVLGTAIGTPGLTTIQCAGEHAVGPYRFDQNAVSWTGSVLLMSNTQLEQYNQQRPGENLRVFVVEDDDTSCQIKMDSTRSANLFNSLKLVYGDLTGGNKVGGLPGLFARIQMLARFFVSATSWFKTEDDAVGNAIEDPVVAGAFLPGANWAIRGEQNRLNGAIRLEMR